MIIKPFLALVALAALATVTAADTNTIPVVPSPLVRITQDSKVSGWIVSTNGGSIGPGFAITFLTNRVTNVLSILSTLPVPGTCPECGSPNHHMAQVRLLSSYDVVYLTATSPGHSNTMQIATGSATNWVSTNLIPKTVQPYASPGAWPASVPPLNQPNR